ISRLETSSSSGNLHKLSRRLVLREKKEPLSPSRSRSISLDWAYLFCFCFSLNSFNFFFSNFSDSQKKKSMSIDIPDSQLPGKRKVDKEKRYLQDSAALFEAVEQQQLDVVKRILGCSNVDINSLNGEDLSVLDIAVMTNNIPMAKMLLSRGAKESPI
ncbi:hypothetical protein EGW08_003292, partial [Elysia chlorotica]